MRLIYRTVTTLNSSPTSLSRLAVQGRIHVEDLCRGEAKSTTQELAEGKMSQVATCVVTITIGTALYGVSLGLWRAPAQAAYVALKLPLLITLTLGINGFVNGMLAQALGSGLTFRQTIHACLMSFTVFSVIVGSLSPALIFMVLNAPPIDSPEATRWHAVFLLLNVIIISCAGIVGNMKLFTVLRAFAGNAVIALRVLLIWLAGNLFAGAQLAWILRPILGNPTLEVQFLREQPFDGNFYQDVWNKLSIASGAGNNPSTGLAIGCAFIFILFCILGWQWLESKLGPKPASLS